MDVATILFFEGLTTGAIYALMALGIVVLYSVTGVINVAQGEFVMLSALTVASLRLGDVPGTLYIAVVGLALWGVFAAVAAFREREPRRAPKFRLGFARRGQHHLRDGERPGGHNTHSAPRRRLLRGIDFLTPSRGFPH